MSEHMSGNDEDSNGDEGGNEELPRPSLTLKEETGNRQDAADDAAIRHRAETRDDTREEAAHADEQALDEAVAHGVDAADARGEAKDGTGTADEEPQLKGDVRLQRAVTRALVVLPQEMDHQRRTHQGDARPEPYIPMFVQEKQSRKFQQENDERRIAPHQNKIHARMLLAPHHLAADVVDDVERPARGAAWGVVVRFYHWLALPCWNSWDKDNVYFLNNTLSPSSFTDY